MSSAWKNVPCNGSTFFQALDIAQQQQQQQQQQQKDKLLSSLHLIFIVFRRLIVRCYFVA